MIDYSLNELKKHVKLLNRIYIWISLKEHPYWALFYHHEGFDMDGDKLMGRQAAGNSFLRALVQDNPDTLVYILNNEQRISKNYFFLFNIRCKD